MVHYIGLDVSLKQTSICVVNEVGSVVRFCFTAHDGEAATPTLTEWARPELVHAGRRPTAVQMVNQARGLHCRSRSRAPPTPCWG
jgi:hypothetical protein